MTDRTTALSDAVSEALAVAKTTSELNEASTCDWIIRPLLHAAGYKRYEILPQGIDATKQKPDYTILPNSEHTWFLEAKAWNNELSDVHVKQSLVYAFTNNRRWAVLTNGQQWRLYDNRIEGELAAKLICEVALADVEAAVRFLEAIGPDSMTGGGIEAFAQNARLAHALAAELSDPESALIKAAHRIMRTQYGLQYIVKDDVCRALRGVLAPPEGITTQPVVPVEIPAPDGVSGSASGEHTLPELLANVAELLIGTKPVEVVLPDGPGVPVKTWVDASVVVVAHIMRSARPPSLPFVAGDVGHRYFLNREPKHPDPGTIHKFESVIVNGQTVYMDKNRSAYSLVAQLTALCRASGLSPDLIRVRLRG